MSVVLVTGSGGLIGSEAVAFFARQGLTVQGLDNDMRRYFFGASASTRWRVEELKARVPGYRHADLDVRDGAGLARLVRDLGKDLSFVLHAAAQPSHDWAAREPQTDFGVNAMGTLNVLEAVRLHAPHAPVAFLSTNKVYGDAPNALPLVEHASRWEIDADHAYHARGIDEGLSIDQSTHSVFGASKVAADVMTQEYGRYFGLQTACFRGGCLTGAGHSGAELHGFLAYLMQCTVTGRPYTVFGYKGKQVRDNIHSHDLVNAIWHFFQAPRAGAVYNIGGGRYANCSMLEAIALCEAAAGRKLNWTYSETNRTGDHIWWISDISRFQRDYPGYALTYDMGRIIEDLFENGRARWLEAAS
jgi:CDP-paratose 2-epimerase